MVKIEGNNSQKVDRRDEHDAKKSEDKKDAKDFKKLLEKKGDKKDKKAAKKTNKKTSKKPAGDKQTNAGSSRKSLGQKSDQRRRSGEFGERLRDGRQQLGEQGERRARVDSERQTSRQYTEKRLDGKKNERHWQGVDKGHAKKNTERKDQRSQPLGGQAGQKSAKSQSAGVGRRGADNNGVQAAEAQADKLAGLAGDAGVARGAGKAENAAPTQRSEMREQVAQLAQKLVEKAHVGQDAAGRRIMLLDLQVPGRGNVRVRLRRRGDGFELRMRPENQELARDLRREREHFRESAAQSGVEFSSIEIV